jgi:hypothetical protein
MNSDKPVKGSFTEIDGEQFYKIENFDHMDDFFMTITSSSDIWNFCWSQGGITAGRKDCDHAVFPYYTADKVSDAKMVTGPYTAVTVSNDSGLVLWEPFAPLLCNTGARFLPETGIERTVYKNMNGTKVWFEEVNTNQQLAFRYGWTSSALFGLVRMIRIENLSKEKKQLTILDGCRNILPACCSADFQNSNSVLLDAYKKTDLDERTNLALFAVSSVVTDKAEPSEGLLANTCWFSTDDTLLLSPDTPAQFISTQGTPEALQPVSVLKGKRASCYICRTVQLTPCGTKMSADSWYQVFDTSLTACRIAELEKQIADRTAVKKALETDIAESDQLMTQYISEADGIQKTADTISCAHHRANVMFNIMRGGLFADNGRINVTDFRAFIGTRNKAELPAVRKALGNDAEQCSMPAAELREKITAAKDPQLIRLFREYLPLIFSRRHGDPSRPWNRFNIKIRDNNGAPILNYEGNWRDIFQNWEALAVSYPAYTENMCAKFLNALTPEGFNPYRITRDGIDWETPDPDNPWAQIGYWGDHQVIYLQKLLELWNKIDRTTLLSSLDDALYSSAHVPYRIKPYADIVKNPRDTIIFDRTLSTRLRKETQKKGTDAKLVQGPDGKPVLSTLTAKLLQIIIAKTANLVPGGGIWMNTQRPEWNDANNALAGYGLSVVTLCYLHRMIIFLIDLYTHTALTSFSLPGAEASCFTSLAQLFTSRDPVQTAENNCFRRQFTDAAGKLFEIERTELYENGFALPAQTIKKDLILKALNAFRAHVETAIRMNRRDDGLYHTYNTMKITAATMEIVPLQEMLEGQVAVLSSGMLAPEEALSVIRALKNSPMFEHRQYSYMLYPDHELAGFCSKNDVTAEDEAPLAQLVRRTGTSILAKDCNGVYHFNEEFRNARIMQEQLNKLDAEKRPTPSELEMLCTLYEKTFNHQNFTGRSGTFYAYEGLGSIYWHMVSKLLLAVQENVIAAAETGSSTAKDLADAYYDVRKGIGFNKEPKIYGAFPADPYSHTPSGQGAKQPGMTGQVKEEVLTRWGELGVSISGGCARFCPVLLRQKEFLPDKTLTFTWCGTPVTYQLAAHNQICIAFHDGTNSEREGNSLTPEESTLLFNRNGQLKTITVRTNLDKCLI